MNDPLDLIILFAAIVVAWMAVSVVVLTFLTGAKRGRDEHGARVRREIEYARAHRNGEEYV